MPTNTQTICGNFLSDSLESVTNATNEITVEKIKIRLIEMEDVLFHLNSAVMMPDKPEGKSSEDGANDDPEDKDIQEKQNKVSGIKALALVFKQCEFYPEYRIVIAGHADTSGKVAFNFELSELRAQNVLYLLSGEEDGNAWANVCVKKQRIEDHQQIMKYFGLKKGWACDPGNIDNKWGDKTEAASKVFFNIIAPDCSVDILKKIKNDGDKKWPVEAWLCVYTLYIEELCSVLGIPETALAEKRSLLKYADDETPFVGCGESFPIDRKDKDNYRSQENRRVEVLFIDEKETYLVKCPATKARKHTIDECPLWDEQYIEKVYIDPNDLYAEIYYLRFVYYDLAAEKLRSVPSGLPLRAFRKDNDEISSEISFSGDVYKIKVRFTDADHKTPPEGFHFRFTLDNGYSYCDTKPEMKILPKADYEKLPNNEKGKYYDLPRLWNSSGYWTRCEATDTSIMDNTDKGGDFIDVLKNQKKLPPFGTATLSRDKPLVFSFDDIVLTDSTLAPIADSTGEGALLGKKFEVVKPDASNNKSYYSQNGIPGRRIPFFGEPLRGVVFNHTLYGVYNDRIESGPFAGYRAAVANHKTYSLLVKGFQQFHYRGFCIGNWDCHLLKMQGFENGEQVAYIFNYFRWHFRDAPSSTPIALPIDQAWINTTITNLTYEWNNDTNNELVSLCGQSDKSKLRIYVRYYMEHLDTITQAMINNGTLHTIISVHPAGTAGRSFMGRNNGEIRKNQNARSGGVFTAAHEYGHAGSLDDDYLEKWNNCCYWQPGFLDFKPGAPYYHDETSIMQSNKVIRSRHYWHFSEWLSKRFIAGKTIAFSVIKKNEPDYQLPYNNSNTWDPANTATKSENYNNYPSKWLTGQTNAKSGKGNFDFVLYPLGKDAYSQGGLYGGKNFTGLVIVKVNMRFKFWSTATYNNIVSTLDTICQNIEAMFLSNNVVQINGSSPYSSTFVQIQPRFLVDNYTPEFTTQLNDNVKNAVDYTNLVALILGKPEGKSHFVVNVGPNRGGAFSRSSWNSSTPPELNLVVKDTGKFWRYFSEMLGLQYKEKLTKSNFDIASCVSGGKMESV